MNWWYDKQERGQAMLEYVSIIFCIAMAVLAVFQALGAVAGDFYTKSARF